MHRLSKQSSGSNHASHHTGLDEPGVKKLRALLVVVNDECVSRLLQSIGTDFDLTYEAVVDEPSVLEALNRDRWDLVLAVFPIPDRDATNLVQSVRKRDSYIPIIVISGVSGEQPAVEMMRAGASDYITKHSLNRLGSAIRRQLDESPVQPAKLQASAELFEREQQLRTITDNVPVFIARVDTETRYLFANEAYRKALNLSPELMVGRTLAEVLGDTAFRKIQKYVELALSGERCSYEAVIEFHTIGRRHMQASYVPEFGPDHKVTGFVLSSMDVSERYTAAAALQESEERLRIALESGRLGIWDYDLVAQKYVEVSDTCKANLGLEPDAEISRAILFSALHPDDRDRIFQAQQSAKENLTDYAEEYRVIWPDGTLHWIGAHGRAVVDETGQAVRMIGTTVDISERKLVEAQKEQFLRDAEDRAKRDPLTNLYNHRVFQKKLEHEADLAVHCGSNLAVAVLDLDNFKFFNDAYGHAVGDDVLRQVASCLENLPGDGKTIARFGGDEFAVLFPDVGDATRSDIEVRLRSCMEGLTYLPPAAHTPIPIGMCVGIVLYPFGNLTWHEIVPRADERLRRAKSSGTAEHQADLIKNEMLTAIQGYSMLDALVTAVDNKDRYTRRHSEDVLTYSSMIARELGFSETELRTVAVSALLHDVGKIGVPDAILRKPGTLTDLEYEAIKQHPQMGTVIVAAVQGLEDTLDAIQHHHERWDGRGYPFGLIGEATPLIARLMAVADAYSAMTTDRPYRKGMDSSQALGILQSGAGTQWDPECVRAFLTAMNSDSINRAA